MSVILCTYCSTVVRPHPQPLTMPLYLQLPLQLPQALFQFADIAVVHHDLLPVLITSVVHLAQVTLHLLNGSLHEYVHSTCSGQAHTERTSTGESLFMTSLAFKLNQAFHWLLMRTAQQTSHTRLPTPLVHIHPSTPLVHIHAFQHHRFTYTLQHHSHSGSPPPQSVG